MYTYIETTTASFIDTMYLSIRENTVFGEKTNWDLAAISML